jgi:lipoprotein NlpD
VVRGDTLTTIAASHGVSVDELRRWNGLARKAAIRPGQILRVAPPEQPASRAVRGAAVSR